MAGRPSSKFFEMGKKAELGRRERIVEAATRSFTTLGYDGTTLGALATELGLSKAAIAYYFPIKDDFLTELVTPLVDRLDNDIARIPTPTWPDDAIAACGAYLDALVDHHPIACWIDTDQALQADPRIGGRLTGINKRLCNTITTHSRKRSDRIRATAVLGGLWRPIREHPTNDIRQHRDEIIHAALISYQPAPN